ncbi:TetR/AcrR family transcriptional regulator [Alkaliphilus peptidifermentans]|uniref:Transcriptional regulator, TetR family n=1 Tax=Alkaliphilus peptidifermentans DSM 18978 TaxID=1120976 RepID=A0A1G5L2Z3_9FIRM|nr:TetR/AcrR family transcriptional regulator [Alkaliphilus peptidifermentans]SCZ06660.1 transcriptional regulator, TetR family [Alkaliphilus peptidifermentans DSM 18978]
MDKKEIQKRRMMGYFIEATKKIAEEEGTEAVTVRKVADLAGYNSATLYNYFDNLEHLIFFASMQHLKDYVVALPGFVKASKNSLDKYFRIWKCFCQFSFNNPKIYHSIFFNKYSTSIKDAIQEYYSIFPEELGEQPEDLLKMLLKNDIYARNKTLLEASEADGFIPKEHIEEINEMTLLIYQGMFMRFMNGQTEYTPDEAVERTINYIQRTIIAYGGRIEEIPE